MSLEEVYDVSCSIRISISLEERVIHLLSDISSVFSEILLESEHEKSIHHDQFGKTKNEEKEYKKDLKTYDQEREKGRVAYDEELEQEELLKKRALNEHKKTKTINNYI
jgi:hypothetical protein